MVKTKRQQLIMLFVLKYLTLVILLSFKIKTTKIWSGNFVGFKKMVQSPHYVHFSMG